MNHKLNTSVLQKSKKVIIKVQKDVRKVVPHSSKLGQTTNIYIGHIQEYHYVSTTPALSSPEITRDSGLIKKSVSSHEDKGEQYKESHFSQKKQSQLANTEKDNRKGANISEAGLDSDTDMEPKKKIENHKTTKREFMQKKRAQAVNLKRLKIIRSRQSRTQEKIERFQVGLLLENI